MLGNVLLYFRFIGGDIVDRMQQLT